MPQRKPNVALSNKEMEQKIMGQYNKTNPQPHSMKEKVDVALNKLNK